MVILGGVLGDGSYQMIPYSAVPNQKKKFFDTGVSLQNDVSYSVGNEENSFYLSAQDVKTTGTIPGDKNRRTGMRVSEQEPQGFFMQIILLDSHRPILMFQEMNLSSRDRFTGTCLTHPHR